MSSPRKLNNKRTTGIQVLNNLKLHLDLRKSEIKARFKVIRRALEERENELLKQLDDCYDTISEDLTFESPRTSVCVKKDDKVLSLKRIRSYSKGEKDMGKRELQTPTPRKLKIPHYQIDWDISLQQTFTEGFCKLTQFSNDYVNCIDPQPFESSISFKANLPEGVAVSVSDRKVYFADYGHDRILVADQDTKRIVEKITAKELQWPQYLCVDGDFLYASCCGDYHLVKIDRSKNKVIATVKAKEQISGVAVDKAGQVYTCDVDGLVITVWSKELIRIRSFRLDTMHTWEDTTTWDIKIQDGLLYVLFLDSPYPIQTFDLEGGFVKELVGANRLNQSYHLNLDLYGNIIVSEPENNCVKVFTRRGDQMHCIKDLQQPSGLGVTSLGQIVMCNDQKLCLL